MIKKQIEFVFTFTEEVPERIDTDSIGYREHYEEYILPCYGLQRLKDKLGKDFFEEVDCGCKLKDGYNGVSYDVYIKDKIE